MSSDLISRQAAIEAVISLCDDCNSGYCGPCRVNYPGEKDCRKVLEDLSPAQKKEYTKADYIMALHKEYGCSIAKAEEAHQKALEYLRNTSMMKGRFFMDDYISRKGAVDELQEKVFHNLTDEYYGAMQVLNELPAADVTPVVHGKWERHMSFGICDKCRYEYDWKATDARNFCPNCGAKMDGGDADD